MDIGVKERLTGALIVVALVVLLVPSILYGPGDGDTGAGQAADGPPLRTYSMDLGADAGQDAQGQSALAPQNAQNAQSPEAQVRPVEPAPAQTAPAQAAVSEPTLPVPAAVPPASTSPASPPAPKPAPAASDQPVPAGSWWVQLGSFSQSANAQRLVQQLSAKGFRARVSPVKNKDKELFRVRAGPVGDRAAAEALQARLAAAGYKGSLVAP